MQFVKIPRQYRGTAILGYISDNVVKKKLFYRDKKGEKAATTGANWGGTVPSGLEVTGCVDPPAISLGCMTVVLKMDNSYQYDHSLIVK